MRLACACIVLLAGSALCAQSAHDTLALDVLVDEPGTSRVLRAADFTVTDGGTPLAVEAVTLVQPSTNTAPLPPITTRDDETRVAADASRSVAIYIYEYHLRDDAAFSAARAAVAAFVRRLGPRDLVVVRKPLDSLVTIRTTTDHAAAARIVEAAVPREDDLLPRSAFEQQFIATAPARIRATRRQIAVSSLSALVSHLGSLPGGRKTLVLLSNGFSVPPAATRGEPTLPGIDGLVGTANRERVAIYGVRPAPTASSTVPGDAGPAAPSSRELLVALAVPTSGFVVDGGDAAAAGLQRVLDDASSYYLLTVRTSQALADGGLRPLDVRRLRSITPVRARAAFGVHRDALPAFVPRTAGLPEGLTVRRRTSPLILTWFGQSAVGDGRTRIAFVWEPAARVPGARGPLVRPSRIAMAVTTMDGTPVCQGGVSPSGRDAVVASQRPELAFDAVPATLLVQMDVMDAGGRVLDRDVRDLVVTSFTAPVTFGSPAVYRARSARELRGIGEGRTPPVASRQFSRAEQLVVRIPVSGAGLASTVRARLQSRFGSRLRDLLVHAVDIADGTVQVELALAGLASGEYALEFEAPGARAAVVARLEFAVTP